MKYVKSKIFLITILILAALLLTLIFNLQQPESSDARSDTKSNYTAYVEMPDGGKVIVEVRYEDNTTKLTVKLPEGLTLGSEEGKGRISEDEAKDRAIKLVKFLKTESRHQAMSRIIFWGMEKGVPDNGH